MQEKKHIHLTDINVVHLFIKALELKQQALSFVIQMTKLVKGKPLTLPNLVAKLARFVVKKNYKT